MSYENGKKLTLGGFALFALIAAFNLVYFLLSYTLDFYSGLINDLRDWGALLAMVAVAGGYAMMWLTEKKNTDALAAGATGFFVILTFAGWLDLISINSNTEYFIITALMMAFYPVLALRAKEKNVMLAAALAGAYVFEIFAMIILEILAYDIGLPYFLVYLFMYTIRLVGPAACFLIAKNEQ